MSQTAWRKTGRAERETEGKDEEVLREIPRWLQESSKSFAYELLHNILLYLYFANSKLHTSPVN